MPGKVAPLGKFEHEEKAFRESIEKKPLPELKDLLSRQIAILSNQKLIEKLPDKGAKVQKKKVEIEKLIETRSQCKIFSMFTIMFVFEIEFRALFERGNC